MRKEFGKWLMDIAKYMATAIIKENRRICNMDYMILTYLWIFSIAVVGFIYFKIEDRKKH